MSPPINQRSLAQRQEVANKTLIAVVNEALPREHRENVRYGSHRGDLSAALELQCPGIGLRVLALIEQSKSDDALTQVKDGLTTLADAEPELFLATPTEAELLELLVTFFGRDDESIRAAAHRERSSDQGRKTATDLRRKMRLRHSAPANSPYPQHQGTHAYGHQ